MERERFVVGALVALLLLFFIHFIQHDACEKEIKRLRFLYDDSRPLLAESPFRPKKKGVAGNEKKRKE